MKVRNTPELKVGDVVQEWGMRVRLDDGGPARGHHLRDVYHFSGTVLNLDEVLKVGFVPPSFLCTSKWDGSRWVTDRRDHWIVQGNELATWAVEEEGDK